MLMYTVSIWLFILGGRIVVVLDKFQIRVYKMVWYNTAQEVWVILPKGFG